MTKKLAIEIVYAKQDKQCIIKLSVEAGCTIEKAIIASGILSLYPEIDLNTQKVGIFSKQKKLTDTVSSGDRVEIYRPLTCDPKEARRRKAKGLLKKELKNP